ncbi:helix-turn-helix domain-containing protein [Methylobacillus glycogenes]|uniref:helix-turn-helix domain-containing protein n=1 Tax=Methylobacillus glycogenes TaxID=406 RepID=UPI00046FD378|nr:helix-turn-helix transcriptional regulator [Methylobacillus glycogenes]
MLTLFEKLPAGFGKRLKSERKRLGLTQTDFGDKAGVQRFTQYQYEAEVNSPSVRYLASILEIGVDLTFLLFGVRVDHMALPSKEMQMIERKVFDLLDQNEKTLGESLTPEKRYVMFDLIRSHLVQSKLNESTNQLSASYLEKNHGR